MSVPNLQPLIEPLTTRFPSAWAKCLAPHDDGEFNARVCAVLYYEKGLTKVGRNGKRGNPKDLSKDIINWKGEGDNFDPTQNGLPCTIIDFIAGHESASAKIDQFYPDPNGPGAWVKPLTLAEIDAGAPPAPPAAKPYPGDPVWDAVGVTLFADYARAGQSPNPQMGRWWGRTIWDATEGDESGKVYTVDESIAKHRKEWCAALGIPVA